ncbi:TlpA disulfide reductase family protein [Nocardioides pantholopis]|uniref:TlpA disulfide reductase family protein n=1 Tax=Nocardioides pantholopis TaxID=2483798 RepID=UPI000F079089|nr:TlpA disulfide reductase family protein [Nocardioides pantholopis]
MSGSRARSGVLLACLLLLLPGCSSLGGTNDGGYISGEGRVVQFEPGDRSDPIELAGKTLEGDPIDLAERRGEVVVVNAWWSGCPPCRTEMPMLVEAERELAELDVSFVGVNIRDNSPANGLAFQRQFGVDYPSIYAVDGQALLAFSGVTNLRTIPTTLVLDREGRVAALVNGDIPSKLTLVDVVEEVAAEDAPAGSGA